METFNGSDPFELASIGLWRRSHGEGSLERAIETNRRFRAARTEFYRVGGWHAEWALWKRFLKGSEEYLVEDSDGEDEVVVEVGEAMLPGAGSVGIPELDIMKVSGENEGEPKGFMDA